MPPLYDYLGVWTDPPDPLPAIDPVRLTVHATQHVRWVDADGVAYPDEARPTPEVALTPDHDLVKWATSVSPGASYQEKRVAACVLHFGHHPNAQEFLEKSGTGAWLGVAGRRATGRMKVSAVERQADGEFGPVYRVEMEIGAHPCVWWTGENCWVNPGDEGDVRYTVKAHIVINGVRVTQVKNVQKVK